MELLRMPEEDIETDRWIASNITITTCAATTNILRKYWLYNLIIIDLYLHYVAMGLLLSFLDAHNKTYLFFWWTNHEYFYECQRKAVKLLISDNQSLPKFNEHSVKNKLEQPKLDVTNVACQKHRSFNSVPVNDIKKTLVNTYEIKI